MRRCCCSTMRCRRSMRTPRSASSRRCGRRGAGAASSSSATGCRRCRTRTRSWCCATAAWPSAATTPRCSPPPVGTRPSGGCNSSRRRLSAADEAGDGPAVRGAALALLRRAAAPDRTVLARAFFWLVVAAGLDAAGPVLGKSFLDRHVVPHAGPIWAIAGLLGGAWAAGSLASVLRYGQLVQLSGVAMRSVQRLRDRVYGHVLGLPMAFFDRAIVGQLVSRITNDTEQVKTLYVQALFVTLDSVVVLGAMIATMAWLNWRLMLIVATLAPAVAAIVWAYQRLSAPAVTRSRALRSDINAQVAETIAGDAVVQAAGAAQRFSQRFAATNEAHYAARRGELRANAWLLRPALDLLDVAILAAVIAVYGARHDDAGALGPLEVGVLYAFVSWIARIVEPLTQITMQFSQLQQAMVAAARVNALLEQAQAPRPRGSAVVGAGRIELDRLSFGYIAGMPVLRELSLTIEPGRFVGIVGATGSGKSTLLALLLRFYAADRGTLRIDGRPIEEYADEGLHDRIAFVPQEPFLLAARVRRAPRAGLRHRSGRTRRAALGGREAADRDRPRDRRSAAHPAARRGHCRDRQRDRSPGAAHAGGAARPRHRGRGRAPVVDRARRRRDRRSAPRPDRRARQPRRADGDRRRPVPAPGAAAAARAARRRRLILGRPQAPLRRKKSPGARAPGGMLLFAHAALPNRALVSIRHDDRDRLRRHAHRRIGTNAEELAASGQITHPRVNWRTLHRSTAERHPQAARGVEQRMAGGHRPGAAGHIGQRHRDDRVALQRHHRAENAAAHQLGGMPAEAGREHAVERRRRAAALGMAEQRRAHLARQPRLQVVLQHRADAAKADRVGAAGDRLRDRHRAAFGVRAFGDADQRPALVGLARAAMLDHGIEVVRDLGQQDHVGRAGEAAVQRDPAGVASHRLGDHHPAVAARGGFEPVERLGDDRDRAVEAEAQVGVAQVVVDRLGNADHRQAERVHPVGDLHRAVAADRDQRIELQVVARVGEHLGRHVGAAGAEVMERVAAVVRAQHRPALRDDACYRRMVERPHAPAHEAEESALDPGDARAALVDQRQRDRADDRVQPRAVAAAGEDADVHHAAVNAATSAASRAMSALRVYIMCPAS